jgi:serine/threonine protein kinase
METKNTCSKELGILDDRYQLIKIIGSGYSSEVYIVEDLQDDNKKYACKIFKRTDDYHSEVEINEIITKANNSSFIKYITSSVGYLIRNGEKTLKPYIVFELGSKGDVIHYITCNKTGLDEKNSKLMFSKIIAIVKALHKLNICHRDLKLENILFDENLNIKLCDFGFSIIIPKNKNGKAKYLTGQYGTPEYTAPEIFENKPYDGEKIDIFSLGVILFNLRVCSFGFTTAKIPQKIPRYSLNIQEKLYKYIKEKNYPLYWKLLGGFVKLNGISEEFKNLYLKMVAYNPKERPTIEEIYNHEWMKEIRDLNEDEFEEYEKDLIKELKSREEYMNEENN